MPHKNRFVSICPYNHMHTHTHTFPSTVKNSTIFTCCDRCVFTREKYILFFVFRCEMLQIEMDMSANGLNIHSAQKCHFLTPKVIFSVPGSYCFPLPLFFFSRSLNVCWQSYVQDKQFSNEKYVNVSEHCHHNGMIDKVRMIRQHTRY